MASGKSAGKFKLNETKAKVMNCCASHKKTFLCSGWLQKSIKMTFAPERSQWDNKKLYMRSHLVPRKTLAAVWLTTFYDGNETVNSEWHMKYFLLTSSKCVLRKKYVINEINGK